MRRIGFVSLVTVVLLAGAAMAYAGNGKAVPGWHSNSAKYTAIAVTNPNDPADVSSKLVRERTPDAVLAQHIEALNACDWAGLMQQYPDSYELRLPGGTVVTGRLEAAATFAGFVYWQAVNKNEPLIPLRIFRDRNFSLANAGGAIIGFVIYGFIKGFENVLKDDYEKGPH